MVYLLAGDYRPMEINRPDAGDTDIYPHVTTIVRLLTPNKGMVKFVLDCLHNVLKE
jgi:hypothetical protein